MKTESRAPAGVLSAFAAAALCLLAAPCLFAPRLAAQVLQTGTIAGTVTDAAGKPLSGVQVVLDTGQADVTNSRGYFAATAVLPGAHTVEASLVGYAPVRATNVVVTQELTTTITLRLTERRAVALGSTQVTAPLLRKNVTPTMYTVTSKEEQLVRTDPNNLYQYPGAALSQPGVVPDADGFPSIRGSRRLQVGYMLDGILLTMPSSSEFATGLSTVGMDRLNVYTGGYRAELGSAIGGFLNAVVKTGASMRGQAAIEATTGSWDYSGLVYEQGNVEKSGFNWYVSGNAWRTRFDRNPAYSGVPVSADLVAKVIQPVGKKDRFTALLTTGYSRYEVPTVDPVTGEAWGGTHAFEFNDATRTWASTPETQDYLNQQYSIGSLTWSRAVRPAATLSAQVYGWDRKKSVNAMDGFSGWWDSKVHDRLAASRLDYSDQVSDTLQVRLGTELIKGTNGDRLARYAESGAGPRGAYLRFRDAGTTDLNGYLSLTAKPGSRLTADLGLRYDSRTYHRSITPEEIAQGNPAVAAADLAVYSRTGRNPKYDAVTPRLGLTFSLNTRTLLKASAGRYLQFAPANYIENRFAPLAFSDGTGDPNYYVLRSRKVFDVGPEKVDSLDVGIERQIGPAAALSVTPFWRRTKDMIDRGPEVAGDGRAYAAYSNLAHGHTRGVETKLTLRERKGLSGWLTYTFQDARANAIGPAVGQGFAVIDQPDDEFRVSYDQRHTIYVVGQYAKGLFEVNPVLELGSGYPWGGQPGDSDLGPGYALSPVDGETPLPILVNGRVQETGINPYNTGWHKNLSVTFRLYNNAQKSSYYFVQVQNILNSRDVTAKFWQNPYTGSNAFGNVPGPVTYVDENGTTQTAPGHFEYKPWTRIPPVFVLMGVRQTF